MPFSPDHPFPKSPGDPFMAKDWNDAIVEVQRLDTAKVNRAGADTLTGPLTIAGALAVGTSAPPPAGVRLQVVDTASPAVARVQSTASFGAARLELWSDPPGSATEWRPGYIESFDNGGFTGGLRFVTNGTGSANRQGAVEQLRISNGAVGVGVTNPGFRLDVGGRSRFRGDAGATAGVWLYSPGAAAPNDRAFVGLANDNEVGLWGNTGAMWGLLMNTSTGAVGVGIGDPDPSIRLDVGGRSRFRNDANSAGFWLYSSGAPAPKDRAFIGLANDNQVGLWGNTGAGWGLVMDTTTGDVTVQPGNLKLGGSRLYNSQGFGILETNATDWLRINPDQRYPSIALYKPVALGTGGLAVGDWSQQGQGNLWVTNQATIGTRIQLNDPFTGGHYLSMYFEPGNQTAVFYHQSGAGSFMRQDGVWQHNSDASLKENVASLSGVLARVVQLRPVTFDWKGIGLPGLGFVAQEVEPLFPELVSEHQGPDGKPIKGLPYSAFGVLAISALQELKRQHEARLETLEAQIRALTARP